MPYARVYGSSQLQRTLKRAGVGMDDLKDLHKQGAELAAARARIIGPRRTGRLVGTVRVSGTARAGVIRMGNTATPYANPIHWGWPARGIEANPFVTRAAQETESEWVDLYERRSKELLDQVRGI
ncbi:HK97 gp10 family phage protein [Nocardia goodfellowii]